jgi:hypothetical protein
VVQLARLVWQFVRALARAFWWLLTPLRWLYGLVPVGVRTTISKPFVWLWTTLRLRFRDTQSDEKWGYFVWA